MLPCPVSFGSIALLTTIDGRHRCILYHSTIYLPPTYGAQRSFYYESDPLVSSVDIELMHYIPYGRRMSNTSFLWNSSDHRYVSLLSSIDRRLRASPETVLG